MQIKTTLRYHFTLVRMAKIKIQITTHAGEDVEQGEHSSTDGGSANLYNCFGSQCGGSSEKLGINLAQDPAILLLSIYPKEAQSYQKCTFSTIFIAALFVIARTWKQPRRPSTE